MVHKKKSSEDITRIEDLGAFEHASEDLDATPRPPERPEFLSQEVQESTSQWANEEVFEDLVPPINNFQEHQTLEEYQPPENEIKNTAELSTSLKSELNSFQMEHVPLEGVPPFTLLVTDLHHETDKLIIKNILKKIGFYQDETMAQIFDRSLERGVLQISQVNEYLSNYLFQEFQKTSAKVFVFHGSHKNETTSLAETSATLELNQTSEASFPEKEDIYIHSSDQIPGFEIIESLGPLLQSVWVMTPKRENFFSQSSATYELSHLPSIKQEIRLRKGNALIQWKVELMERGEFRGKQVLCSGLIVRVVKL